jgi:hypothetical protein
MTDTNSTKPKRGRKPKALTNPPPEIVLVNEEVSVNPPPVEKITILVSEPNTAEDADDAEADAGADVGADVGADNKPLPKKRGRKPKGGKIVQPVVPVVAVEAAKENIILHLKCSLKDLNIKQNEDIESYNFSSEIVYEPIHQDTSHIYVNHATAYDELSYGGTEAEPSHSNTCEKDVDTKEIWKKLKQLEHSLHLNNINDKKSACFWCTHDFDNPPVYIPKYFLNESYHVYGCFCSPECSVAYLMEENIDSSTKFERYHLLNHIYTKIYDYKKNIKPAPNPYYMLEKYYGNLSIQEYRTLLSNERLFLIVDKPLTRIMPELHQDNEDYIINNKIIPTNNQGIKKKLQRKTPVKTNIFNEKFGQNAEQ